MTDSKYVAVSLKSDLAAHWVRSTVADEGVDVPLDLTLKRKWLTVLSERMLQAYDQRLEALFDAHLGRDDGSEQPLDEEDLPLLERLLHELENGLAVSHPDHFPVLFIPMDLNGMILAVLSPYPDTGSAV